MRQQKASGFGVPPALLDAVTLGLEPSYVDATMPQAGTPLNEAASLDIFKAELLSVLEEPSLEPEDEASSTPKTEVGAERPEGATGVLWLDLRTLVAPVVEASAPLSLDMVGSVEPGSEGDAQPISSGPAEPMEPTAAEPLAKPPASGKVAFSVELFGEPSANQDQEQSSKEMRGAKIVPPPHSKDSPDSQPHREAEDKSSLLPEAQSVPRRELSGASAAQSGILLDSKGPEFTTSIEGSEDSPATPPPAASAEPLEQRREEGPRVQPLREVSIALGSKETPVAVRIRDAEGSLHVAVRSSDPAVSSVLRNNLQELANDLSALGMDPRFSTPGEPQAIDVHGMESAGGWRDSERDAPHPGHHAGQDTTFRQRQNRRRTPDWLDAIEAESSSSRQEVTRWTTPSQIFRTRR